MMESQSKQRKIVILQKHLGFLKIALQTGVDVIPVLSFGEVEVMDFIRIPSLQNFFISRVGLPVPFFPYGMFGLPIPRPVTVTVVMGKPMSLGYFPGNSLQTEDLERAKDKSFAALKK